LSLLLPLSGFEQQSSEPYQAADDSASTQALHHLTGSTEVCSRAADKDAFVPRRCQTDFVALH